MAGGEIERSLEGLRDPGDAGRPKTILEETVAEGAQLTRSEQSHLLGCQGRRQVRAHHTGVTGVRAARLEVDLVGIKSAGNGDRLAGVGFVLPERDLARASLCVPPGQGCASRGLLEVIGRAELSCPVAAIAGHPDDPCASSGVASIAERDTAIDLDEDGLLGDRQPEPAGAGLELGAAGVAGHDGWCPSRCPSRCPDDGRERAWTDLDMI